MKEGKKEVLGKKQDVDSVPGFPTVGQARNLSLVNFFFLTCEMDTVRGVCPRQRNSRCKSPWQRERLGASTGRRGIPGEIGAHSLIHLSTTIVESLYSSCPRVSFSYIPFISEVSWLGQSVIWSLSLSATVPSRAVER